ncbi:MAG: CRISPR-associated helicase Cas3' [Lachnospiraceae bacterium]|nr:CRISPR-associated helicase Cas3' [Lachnospiraceae bacterium]
MLENWKLCALWAKKPKNDDPDKIVSLQTHLEKTANVARELWEHWLPEVLKEQLEERLLIFLAYAHDLGKASPVFQRKRGFNTKDTDDYIYNRLERADYALKQYREENKTPHALVSFGILRQHGFSDSISVVVGGHHGAPPTRDEIKALDIYDDNCGFDEISWKEAQEVLLEEALMISGLTKEEASNRILIRSQQVLYSGLIILADWIASSEQDAGDVMPNMWFPQMPESIYRSRFGIENPRPVQVSLVDAVRESNSPGIFIVEAPMGEGKTEAALAAAEILASKKGCRGVYFALPSQATSNAMLTRVKSWMEHFEDQDGALSIRLAHGKAEFNEEYEGILLSGYNSDDEDGNNSAVVYDWLVGRKKGILADFIIGTIDHVLMAGLKQKHLALRHLGLSNKVLIIDECHAYDVYMESYLLTAIKWLGAYGVPIIILSATLPTRRRRALIAAYFGKKEQALGLNLNLNEVDNWATTLAYPLVTYTDGQEVKSVPIKKQISGRSKVVEVEKLGEENWIEILKMVLVDGGCAGFIFNTVKKAQEAYEKVVEEFGEEIVELYHAGFIAADRAKREKELLAKLGKDAKQRPEKRIIIGTQVFEQSLDIDFDVMFSQLCPIDLLLQRLGRLHRHDRKSRPNGVKQSKCYIMGAVWGGFDDGSKAVYGEYLLMRTCRVLEKWSSAIKLPDDIPLLVAQVYNEDLDVCPPVEYVEDYEKASQEHERRKKDRKERAKGYQIKGSLTDDYILGWLANSRKDVEGEAAVRDGADALEVLLVQRKEDALCLLPWIEGGKQIPEGMPDHKLAKMIAGCSVRLPLIFSRYEKDLDETISYIENEMRETGIVDSWYESYWLKGSLVLILDEDLCVVIGKHKLQYNERLGLRISKVE